MFVVNSATNNQLAVHSRRSTIVWGSFVAAMTLVGGILVVTDPSPAPNLGSGRSLANIPAVTGSYRTVFDTATPIDPNRWDEIIIEDSGQPHGSVETLSLEAQADGKQGLPEHFLIGNGNGMGDGDLHMSYRWNTQMSATGNNPADSASESRAIRICVVGNVRNRPFTDRQLERLAALVAGLQEEFRIPSSRIRFAGPLLDAESGGEHFDQRAFARLLADARQSG